MIFGNLNINSLRNKREFFELLIRNHFVIFLVSKTKFDFSFLGSKFAIPDYRLFRKDRNQHGEGLIFYVNQDIPCKTINTLNFPNILEGLPLEVNLRNKKLATRCYKPPSHSDEYFFDQLHDALSFCSTTYNNFLMLGIC